MDGAGDPEKECQPATDTEADHADAAVAVRPARNPIDHILDRIDGITLSVLNIQKEPGKAFQPTLGHQVGSNSQVTQSGKAVGYAPDVVVETESLVENDDSGPRTRFRRHGQISGNRVAGKVESQVAAHVT